MREGMAQLLMGALIAVLLALVMWGPKADTPVLFGMTLGSLEILIGACVVLAAIVRSILSPPQDRRAMLGKIVGLVALCMSLVVVVDNARDRFVHMLGIAVIASAVVLALFLFARSVLRGTQVGGAR